MYTGERGFSVKEASKDEQAECAAIDSPSDKWTWWDHHEAHEMLYDMMEQGGTWVMAMMDDESGFFVRREE